MKVPRWSLYWELINGPAAGLTLVIVWEKFIPVVSVLTVLLWLFALILYYKQKQLRNSQRKLKLSQVQTDEQRRKLEETKNRRDHYELLRQTLSRISEVIKDRTNLQHNLAIALSSLNERESEEPYLDEVLAVLGTDEFSEIIEQDTAYKAILDAIRSQLTGDSFGRHRREDLTFFPHDFFKVTFYRREEKDGADMLHRFSFSSPPGVQPHPDSEWLPADDRAGTMWMAWTTRRTIIIEDVSQPEQREAKGWHEFRHDQHKKYTSLACVPVFDPFADDGIAGVITIDTNREQYFRDTADYQAFLGELLEPYMDYLVLLKYVSITYSEWVRTLEAHETTSQIDIYEEDPPID